MHAPGAQQWGPLERDLQRVNRNDRTPRRRCRSEATFGRMTKWICSVTWAAFLMRLDDPVMRNRVVDILQTAALPARIARHAALYGLAVQSGASAAPDFDPAWKPDR